MNKIGIMGGTFNPIHNGHLAIAKAAYEQFSLEKVLFLPSKKPPHKRNRKIAQDKERMDMVKLAIEPYPFFVFSEIEMEREGYSYTSDTLETLKIKYPEYELCFIIGADSLHYIEDWHETQKIFDLSRILCAPRYPNTKREDYQCREELKVKFRANIDFIDMEPVNISSHEILLHLRTGKEVRNQMPETVYDYIKEHHLYHALENERMESPFDLEELQEILEKELTKKRYLHTLGVSDTAACLSMRYGEDMKRARLAGLLHDCAKCLSDEEIYRRCLEFGIEVSETEKRQPFLLHGKLGAFYAKTRFGISDEDIIMAITYHTTGRPVMSLLEKIVFIADYMEPGRKDIPGLLEIRETVFEDLDKAIYLTLKNTLTYLESQNNGENEIDRMTINAYNYYKDQVERGN